MVRSDFIEYVASWSDLIDFCSEYGLGTLDGVYSYNQLDDYIDDRLTELANYYTWRELYDVLSSIPDGYYFLKTGYMEFVELDYDQDFERFKNLVLEEAEDQDVFDDEESDEEYIKLIVPEDKEKSVDSDLVYEVGQEGVSIEELFALAV